MVDTQYEKDLIINNRELKYSGIFKAEELFAVINRALEQKGYTKREKKTEETVMEGGKRTYVELRPFKEKSNYTLLMIKIKITLSDVTEKVAELHGQKKKFQKGDIEIVFDSWLMTDYESRWGMKPWVFFFKGIINKFVYTFPLQAGFENELVSDTAFIYAQIKKLLSSYGPEKMKPKSEQEILSAVEEEMRKEANVES
ncbi:hypothetical protein HYU22_03950 [Candidatus Woesearchaeota archaeon]|nr:hypothetical protein [Candidatus Woesearchaeota archaeon]